ncbi:serpin family protein, partial [Nocardioides abyssi]
LNEPLEKLGLGVIFKEEANFSGMLESNEKLVVSKVIQKAFIEVNEEGTEAAAATDIVLKLRSRLRRGPRQFTADHPFTVFLRFGKAESSNIL